MIRLSVSAAREKLSEAVSLVVFERERIILRRDGKDVAAIVSVEDLERIQALEDAEDNAAADSALAEVEREGTVPFADLKRELGLD